MEDRRPTFRCGILAVVVTTLISSARAEEAPAGLGIGLHIENDQVLVHVVLPNTSAAASDAIHVGDRIVSIAEENDEPVSLAGLKLTEAVAKIRGTKGTLVRLTIVPAGKTEADSRVVSLRRGDVKALDFFGDGKPLPGGTAAPEIKFTGLLDDKAGDLSQYAGRIVVVEFWASWCGPCLKMLDKVDTLMQEHPEWQGRIEVLAVSVDGDKAKAVEQAQTKNWKRLVPVCTSAEVLWSYHVNALPTSYLIDKEGKILAMDDGVGLQEKLESALRDADK